MKIMTRVAAAAGGAMLASLVAGQALAQDTIRMGLISDRQGLMQSFGIPSWNGTRLAVKEINDAGGIAVNGKKYKIDLKEAESRSNEREASAAAVELINDQKVKFLFGAIGPLAPIVLQLSDPAKVIYFTTSSAAAAQIDKTKYMVITVPPVAVRISISVKGIKEIYPNVKKIALLMTKDATSDQILEPLKAELIRAGYELTTTEMLASASADPSALLTRIRSTKPDLVFVGWTQEPINAVIRANKEIDATPKFFTQGLGCTAAQAAGLDRPYAANTFVGANIENPATPAAQGLADRYRAFTGEANPVGFYSAVWNYDFVYMLAKAIETAGTFTDTDAVLKAMRSISHQGVAGKITVNEKNSAIYGLDFCLVDSPTGKGKTYHIDP